MKKMIFGYSTQEVESEIRDLKKQRDELAKKNEALQDEIHALRSRAEQAEKQFAESSAREVVVVENGGEEKEKALEKRIDELMQRVAVLENEKINAFLSLADAENEQAYAQKERDDLAEENRGLTAELADIKSRYDALSDERIAERFDIGNFGEVIRKACDDVQSTRDAAIRAMETEITDFALKWERAEANLGAVLESLAGQAALLRTEFVDAFAKTESELDRLEKTIEKIGRDKEQLSEKRGEMELQLREKMRQF